MPRLEDLKESLLNLTHEELLNRVREIRADRRISKHAPSTAGPKLSKLGQQERLLKVFDAMTPKEQQAFLKAMGGSSEGTGG